MKILRLSLRNIWYDEIKNNKKRIEYRCHNRYYERLNKYSNGDKVIFRRGRYGKEQMEFIIKKIVLTNNDNPLKEKPIWEIHFV